MRLLLPIFALLLSACSAPAPASPPAAKPSAAPTARPATPTPDPAAAALSIVPLKIDESPLPPREPTPPGFTAGRATPTPFATAEAAWKYVTITFGIQNRSDAPRLVGIAGADATSTNLNNAVLVGRDGTRYKPLRSSSSFGLRTATARSLTTYPVLLRLPPGFRVAAESAGSLSVVAPEPSLLVFKVPAAATDFGTLSIPPLTSLGPKSGDDDVTRQLKPLLGGFQSTELARPGPVTFPTATPPSGTVDVGVPVSVPGRGSVTLVGVDSADPADYEIRNRGWKQVTLSLQYANDQPRAFNEAAWLFGQDGVVYTGDAPTIGEFGRSAGAPDPAALLLWDGRSAGIDSANQLHEPRRGAFLVPRELRNAILVLSGDIDAMFNVTIPT